MRTKYDLTHLSHKAGKIGRLQTISVIPIEAGASIELSASGIARLAPTRKEIVSECQVDICWFFVPYRHVYGQTFINYLKAGRNTLEPGLAGINVAAAYRQAPYLCLNTFTTSSINRALVNGYNRIWGMYYAVPSYPGNNDNAGVNTDYDWFPASASASDTNCRNYGRICARLPHILNGGNTVTTDTTGWEQQGMEIGTDPGDDNWIETSSGGFSILDLAEVQGRYETLLQGAWFTHEYDRLLAKKWGGSATRDADPLFLKPEMVSRQTINLSGHDVDGTDDATLGTFQGKTMAGIKFGFPRKFFSEHGLLYGLALFRYPLVHNRETHYLLNQTQMLYDDWAADPKIIGNTAPINFNPAPWLAGGATYLPGEEVMQAAGQQYRYQNNTVHPNFLTIPGYPFSNWNGGTVKDWYYYQDNEYNETFQTTQIGHWQMSLRLDCNKYSPVPGVGSSIFTGTR